MLRTKQTITHNLNFITSKTSIIFTNVDRKTTSTI